MCVLPELTEVDRQKMLMTTKLTIAKMDENDELCEDEKCCKHDFEILVFNFFFFQRVGVDFR